MSAISEIKIYDIPTERLPYYIVKKGAEQSELEREWVIAENQRLAVLAEVTSWYVEKGMKHTPAESKARTSKEYQEFLAKMGDIKGRLTEARNKIKALDLEVRTRLNKSFQERSEYNTGGLTT